MAMDDTISRELLSASFNLLAKKITYEHTPRDEGALSRVSRLLGRNPGDPAPNMSVKELSGIFKGALKERHPKMDTPYSSTPGELNEHSSMSVSTAFGKARAADIEDSPVVKVDFNHSDMFFGRKFTFDRNGAVCGVSGQPIDKDTHLNDLCKGEMAKAQHDFLSDMSGSPDGGTLALGEVTKGYSNSKLRSFVEKVKDILLLKDNELKSYADSLENGSRPVSALPLSDVVKDYRESREILAGNPFPERKDCVRIQHADRVWARAEEAVLADDSVLSKDLMLASKSSAGRAIRDIGRVWDDSVFRCMTLTEGRGDLSYARRLDMLRQDFVVSAQDSGHSFKETMTEMERHLDGFNDKEKRRIMSDAKAQYRQARRGKLDDLKEFIDRAGSDKGFDYSYGYEKDTLSLDQRREKFKVLSQEYSELYDRLGGKSLSSGSGMFTGFGELREFREVGDRPMIAGTFLGALLQAGLVVQASKKSKALGFLAAGLFCYLAFNQDKLFNLDHKLNDFFRECGLNPSKNPSYKKIYEACNKKATENPEWEKGLLARFPEESEAVMVGLNKANNERIVADNAVKAMKTEKFAPSEDKSSERTFDFVYVNKDNAESVMKSGKVESLSFEQTDYGVPNLLIGNNTYAVPGDGLFIVKDQDKIHSVLSKELFDANFKKLSADKCVSKGLNQALNAVKKVGKGLAKKSI